MLSITRHSSECHGYLLQDVQVGIPSVIKISAVHHVAYIFSLGNLLNLGELRKSWGKKNFFPGHW